MASSGGGDEDEMILPVAVFDDLRAHVTARLPKTDPVWRGVIVYLHASPTHPRPATAWHSSRICYWSHINSRIVDPRRPSSRFARLSTTMAFPMLDTPRTDFGASVTQYPGGLDDFTTENSIPSPSKDGNDLLRQIRGMRNPIVTPMSRVPLADRRNPQPARAEFTPLLKSATRNRRIQTGRRKSDSHHDLEKPPTPAGFRDSFRSDAGELPINSSVLEEETASSAGDLIAAPMVPSSSSAPVTPLSVLRANNGADGGNMATLREQEAVSTRAIVSLYTTS